MVRATDAAAVGYRPNVTTALLELQATIAAVAERTAAGVVRVGVGWRSACGVVIGEGRVLTVARITRGRRVLVTFSTMDTAPGTIGGGPDEPLAAIAVDTSRARAFEMATGPVLVGQPVFAVAPAGRVPRVTFGTVASVEAALLVRGRRLPSVIEHTAPLATGSAGSALVDANGRLLAVNVDRLGGGCYLALSVERWSRDRTG